MIAICFVAFLRVNTDTPVYLNAHNIAYVAEAQEDSRVWFGHSTYYTVEGTPTEVVEKIKAECD